MAQLFVHSSINYFFPVITAFAQYSKRMSQHKEEKSDTSELHYSVPARHITILLHWAIQATGEIHVLRNPVRYISCQWALFVTIMRITLLCYKQPLVTISFRARGDLKAQEPVFQNFMGCPYLPYQSPSYHYNPCFPSNDLNNLMLIFFGRRYLI